MHLITFSEGRTGPVVIELVVGCKHLHVAAWLNSLYVTFTS